MAAKKGYTDAKINMKEIEKIMSPSQLEKAQTLALECLAKIYKGC